MLKKILTLFVIPLTLAAPQLDLEFLSQTPEPVQPGEVVEMQFKITNLGSSSNNDYFFELVDSYPFTIYGDEDNIVKIGKVASLESSTQTVFDIEVLVNENVVERNEPFEFFIYNNPNSKVKYDGFTVDIDTNDAFLQIIETSNNVIAPGKSSPIEIIVKSSSGDVIRNLEVKLDLSDSSLPLIPLSSSSEFLVPLITAGSQDKITFNLVSQPDANPGIFKVPVTLTYENQRGDQIVKEDFIAVTIGSEAKLNLIVKQLSSNLEGELNEVTLEVINSGLINVELLEMEILPSEDFSLINPTNKFYIGEVDSDDTESEDIEIFPLKKDFNIDVQLTYYDANKNSYQEKVSLPVNLLSTREAKDLGLIQTSYSWLSYVFLAILAGGYFIYRKLK